MSRIAKADLHAVMTSTAQKLNDGAKGDGRVSRADAKEVLKTMSGSERALAEKLYDYADRLSAAPGKGKGSQVTTKELTSKIEGLAGYRLQAYGDVNKNGLSKEDIKRFDFHMLKIGSAAATLAAELEGKTFTPALVKAHEVRSLGEFMEKVNVDSHVEVNAQAKLSPEDLSLITKTLTIGGATGGKTGGAGLSFRRASEGLPQTSMTVTHVTDKATGEKYGMVQMTYGGKNTVGAVFQKDAALPVAHTSGKTGFHQI